jgi:hypothetical protein
LIVLTPRSSIEGGGFVFALLVDCEPACGDHAKVPLLASIRTWQYRGSMALETWPATFMFTWSPAPDSAISVTSVWRLQFRSRLCVSAQPGGGLQIVAGGRIAPEQGEYVAAEDIEMGLLGCQSNRLREVLQHGLGCLWFHQAHLATVLPSLP